MELIVAKPVLSSLVKAFDRVQYRYNERLEKIAAGAVSEDSLHSFVTANSRLRQCIEPSGCCPDLLVRDIQRRIDTIVSDVPSLEDLVGAEELDGLIELVRNMQELREFVVAKHICSQPGCEVLVPIGLGAWLNLHTDLETLAMVAENITCSACLERITTIES